MATAAAGGASEVLPLRIEEVLLHRLSEKYVGRIVPGVGLCVTVHTAKSVANGIIRGHSGNAWYTVHFEAVVFRPEVGERMRCTISTQDAKGIYLSVEFFDDILVPSQFLIQPSIFDEAKATWKTLTQTLEIPTYTPQM